MADRGARVQRGDGGGACVGEEVQNAYPAPRALYLPHDVVPVRGLLGEDAGVLEVHGLDVEGELAVSYLPVCRQAPLVPGPAAGVAAGIAPVAVLPARVAARRIPDGLRVGAHEGIAAPALQLFAAGAVDELKIPPVIRRPLRQTPPHSVITHYTMATNRGQQIVRAARV